MLSFITDTIPKYFPDIITHSSDDILKKPVAVTIELFTSVTIPSSSKFTKFI